MAVASIDFTSKELKMNTLVTVSFPDSVRIHGEALSKKKVLWLLHGLSDDGTAWLRYSNIDRYAMENDLVVVMPSVNRSMYCDHVLGQNYFTYIAEELPEYLSLVFGLSREREQNFIAGLSMGGFGAMRIALTYPERYAAVGSFSGILDLTPMALIWNTERQEEFPFLAQALDDPAASPFNPAALLPNAVRTPIPIYAACGLQDDLLITNELFRQKAEALGVPLTYITEPGGHEWAFWDKQIHRFIQYILEKEHEKD